MKRIILSFALAAMAASSPLFAQTQTDFRSAGSGIWTDSQIWEKNEAGVWLKPMNGAYPGERHNRDVDVTVADGSTVTIGRDQIVHVNSLSVFSGRVVVEGMLIVGPTKNDPEDPIADDPFISDTIPANPIIVSDNMSGPQLLQNVPNPLAPQFGYETTIKFYLDKQYASARLSIYDQLAHVVRKVFDEQNPSEGWHTARVRLDGIQSGTYPMILELPSNVLRRMVTVLR
jgi:hypothetical protein